MIEASICLLLLIWSDPHVFVCVFQRLSTANDEIVEVLLSKQQVLGALRFIRSVGAHDNVSARKFLDAARQTNNTMLFYTIFRFFEQRNMRLRGNPGFNQGKWFWWMKFFVKFVFTKWAEHQNQTNQGVKIYFVFIDWSRKHEWTSSDIIFLFQESTVRSMWPTLSKCLERTLWWNKPRHERLQ